MQLTYRPVLEKLHLYNLISGITNNPAESTNAAFKRVTCYKTQGFFEAFSLFYFSQVGYLLEIQRGMENKGGKYTLYGPKSGKILSKVCIPNAIDYIDEDLASHLIQTGKPPPTLFTKGNPLSKMKIS